MLTVFELLLVCNVVKPPWSEMKIFLKSFHLPAINIESFSL